MSKFKLKKDEHTTAREYALQCCVRRALRPATGFLAGGPGLIVLIVPEDQNVYEYTKLVVVALEGESTFIRDLGLMCIKASDDALKITDQFVSQCRDKARAIIIASSRDVVPPFVALAADTILEIPEISARDIQAACKCILAIDVSIAQAVEAVTYASDQLWNLLRVGRSMEETLRRLRQLPVEIEIASNADAPPKATLEAMHGYGAAKEWGLQLATDLTGWRNGEIPWSDVDRGLLLSGPPGTGKTRFASALAESCGAHLVATSLGQWQAQGHLGDLLKAMRSDFAKARERSPSILFIDEIDSVGDRQTFGQTHASYSVQVVNALLECIDGSADREGVVIIGATNEPGRIDPAVLRSGRLDKHVALEMPSKLDRIAILLFHLSDHFEMSDLAQFGAATHGMSGADLEGVARAARRRARVEKRLVQLSDVRAELPQMLEVTGLYRRSVAVHEAGHAIVGSVLGYGIFQGVAIAPQINPNVREQSAGVASFELPALSFRNRDFYLIQIATFLAGIAAEDVQIGSFGDGAGVGSASDLERATAVALLMETRLGMGDCLANIPGLDPDALYRATPGLAEKVAATLRAEFERAKAILRGHQSLLIKVSDELDQVGFVTAERFREIELSIQPRRRAG